MSLVNLAQMYKIREEHKFHLGFYRRRTGVECDGPERGATSPVPLVASRSTWRSGCCIFRVRHRHSTNNRRSLCNMSGSKRLPCQKEACAIQKCLQGMTLILWILIFCSVLEKKNKADSISMNVRLNFNYSFIF